jgi:hypothetical protein
MTLTAKSIQIEPIEAKYAKSIVKKFHYSGKSVPNSQLHLGVFIDGKCHGTMQFGPPVDKRRMLGLVRGTGWHNFLELNRMAFGPALPRNSESRALSVAFRILKKQYPQIKWVLSFSDATQCGDGAIYRASGFLLTNIKKNTSLLRLPNGQIVADKTLNHHPVQNAGWWKKKGAVPLVGYQLRYIKFLDKSWLDRLTVPVIPFSRIKELGASMYLGQRVSSDTSDTPASHAGESGATPTDALQKGGD